MPGVIGVVAHVGVIEVGNFLGLGGGSIGTSAWSVEGSVDAVIERLGDVVVSMLVIECEESYC